MRQRLREAPTTRITLPSEALGKVHGKCKQSERGGRRSGGGGGPAGGDKAIGFCLSLFALMDPRWRGGGEQYCSSLRVEQ